MIQSAAFEKYSKLIKKKKDTIPSPIKKVQRAGKKKLLIAVVAITHTTTSKINLSLLIFLAKFRVV